MVNDQFVCGYKVALSREEFNKLVNPPWWLDIEEEEEEKGNNQIGKFLMVA